MKMDNAALFYELIHFVREQPDRRGYVAIDCPRCGKEARHGETHFNFGEAGGMCFVCGYRPTLWQVAADVGYQETDRIIPNLPRKPKKQKPRYTPDWLGIKPKEYHDSFKTRGPEVEAAWKKYKPLTSGQIMVNCLALGILPGSKCRHQRLILPIFDDGDRLTCLRGRRIECDCMKWTTSGGWKMDSLPLFNFWSLEREQPVLVCENPVDAIMVGNAVATLSVVYWTDKWSEQLHSVRPGPIVIAYDNDLPGNGGAWNRKHMIELWRDGDPNRPIPKANGPKLANRLIAEGFTVKLWDWKGAAHKADIGDIMREELV